MITEGPEVAIQNGSVDVSPMEKIRRELERLGISVNQALILQILNTLMADGYGLDDINKIIERYLLSQVYEDMALSLNAAQIPTNATKNRSQIDNAQLNEDLQKGIDDLRNLFPIGPDIVRTVFHLGSVYGREIIDHVKRYLDQSRTSLDKEAACLLAAARSECKLHPEFSKMEALFLAYNKHKEKFSPKTLEAAIKVRKLKDSIKPHTLQEEFGLKEYRAILKQMSRSGLIDLNGYIDGLKELAIDQLSSTAAKRKLEEFHKLYTSGNVQIFGQIELHRTNFLEGLSKTIIDHGVHKVVGPHTRREVLRASQQHLGIVKEK